MNLCKIRFENFYSAEEAKYEIARLVFHSSTGCVSEEYPF